MMNISISQDFSKPVREALQGGLAVARVGLPVFPCNADKRPTCPHGFKDAARLPAAVRKLWELYPGVLVGVPTGVLTNLSVIDLDSKHHEARVWCQENRERLGKTRTHRTRSGGLHLLYKYQSGLRCSTSKLAPGVDVRSEGGYVIWWPAHGCEPPDNSDPAPFPPWLWEALKPPPPPPRVPFQAGKRDDSAMRGLMRRIVCASNGERNAVLFWAACRTGEHVRAGRVREAYAVECLMEAAVHIGLTQREATRTINSGMRRG
jgi:hypothetical protein